MAFVMRLTATGAAALIASLLLSATGAAGTAPVDASFAPGPSLPAGPTPSAVAVADFDGNGSPDLAISNDGYRSNLRILLNDGGGQFRTAQGSPFKVDGAGSVVAGDFNGDGKQDIAAATSDGVAVFLGNGAGQLVKAGPPVVLPGGAESLAAPGDLNGDGKADLVAVDHENAGFKIRILLGDGTGGFTVSPQTPPVTVKGDPSYSVALQVQIADFNGDGVLDLAAAGTANVWILLNDGTARFALALGSPFKVTAGVSSFVQGDFNGDGKPDLGAQGWAKGSDWPSLMSILLSDGAGKFQLAHAAYRIGVGDQLISADFNGDGRPDLALTAGEYDEFVSLLVGTSSGFRQARFAPTVADTTGPLAVADFNGDGKLDILALSWGVPWWPDSPRENSILFQTSEAPAIAAARALPASADRVYSAHGRGGIYGLAADGNRAAICDSGVPVVWTPGRKAVAFRKSYEGDYGCYGELALGGGKVAWMEQGCGNTSCDVDVFAAKLPNGRPHVVEGGIENYCGAGPCDLSGDWAGQLMGAGPILVHDLWSVDCILPPPPPDCDMYGTCPEGCDEGNSTLRDFGQGLERLAPGRRAFLPGRFPVRAVGGGRIAVEPAGKILVLHANGSPLASVAGTDPARGIALSASELAVLRTFDARPLRDHDRREEEVDPTRPGRRAAALRRHVEARPALRPARPRARAPERREADHRPAPVAGRRAPGRRQAHRERALLRLQHPRKERPAEWAGRLRADRQAPGQVLMRRLPLIAGLAAIALSSGLAPSSAANQKLPSFAAGGHYPTGAGPDAIAVGDLNGDGRPDVVTADYGANTVSEFLNAGNGTMQALSHVDVGPTPFAIAAGDLNGDGKADVVTANFWDDTITVLLADASGGLGSRHDYETGAGPSDISVRDLDGDGKADVVVTSDESGTVSVFPGKADGSLGTRRDFATGAGADGLAIGDFNGDGKPDLAVANGTAETISVLQNQGGGDFAPAGSYPFGGGWPLLVSGDLNGDGKADLVVSDVYGVGVLVNHGDGSFGPARRYRVGGWVALGDLNGDGAPDLLVNDGEGPSVLLNRGNGTFKDHASYPGGYVYAIADLNGDGRLDIVSADGEDLESPGRLSLLINTPGLCNVQGVWGLTVAAAKAALASVNCRAGKITRAHDPYTKKGLVRGQSPKFGAVKPGGSKVNLVVSLGPKRHK